MPNILTLTADDTEELLNAGAYGTGALLRLQSSATYGGAYADVSGTGSTPTIALVSGQRAYAGYDPAGTSGTWYRIRYENSGGSRVSDWSTPFLAGAGPYLCTDEQVKARIFPNGVTDTSDDVLIDELIAQVSTWMQNYTGRRLVPETAATYTFDTVAGYILRVPRGIRAITSMGVAMTHQPDSGGSYTTIPASDRLLRPLAVDLPEGWPPTEVRLSRGTLSGTIGQFSSCQNGATITGDFGFAAVPRDIEAVAIDAVVAAYASRKNGASSVIGVDETGVPPWSLFFGRGSPQRGTLDRYRYFGV